MAEKNNQKNKQTPEDVFIQTLIDEISQKTATIAQLNANVYNLNTQLQEVTEKYEGMPENHSKNK